MIDNRARFTLETTEGSRPVENNGITREVPMNRATQNATLVARNFFSPPCQM
ncbi:hypothetical protein K0U07_00790 [bacterium]|nr:hypothetical protein [bacterium]